MQGGRKLKGAQLVAVDARGILSLHPSGVELLRNIITPFKIISICGPYRSGKSFILNQLIGVNQLIFDVASTTEACTRGLWIYLSEHEELGSIIFMDSEGLGGIEKTQTFDVKIFCLCVLLSSMLIYNTHNAIDENSIQQLSLVTELCKKIKVSKDTTENRVVQDYFPAFMWLVRDFHLELVDEYNSPITNNEYLESALKEQQGFTKQIMTHNNVRTLIKTFFKRRHCFTLIRPMHEESALQDLAESTSKTSMRKLFMTQLEEFKSIIFRSTKTKSINDVEITGGNYINLVEFYIQQMNAGAVPVISDAWTQVANSQIQKAYNKSLEDFNTKIRANLKGENANKLGVFKSTYEDAKAKSFRYFEDLTTNFVPQRAGVKEKLEAEFQVIYESLKKGLNSKVIARAEEYLNSKYFESLGIQKITKLELIQTEMDKIKIEYFSIFEFSEIYEIWCKFYSIKFGEAASKLIKHIENKAELELIHKDAEINRLEETIRMKEEVGNAHTRQSMREGDDVREKLISGQLREKDLLSTIQAYKKIAEEKDQEIAQYQNQIRTNSKRISSLAATGQSIHRVQYDDDKENGPMKLCGAQGQCYIF